MTTALGDIETAAGAANLGTDEPFVPTAYRFQARAVDPTEISTQDPAPTVVDWPAASASLAGHATECARVDAAAVGSLFTDAKQNTYFKDGDIVYQVVRRRGAAGRSRLLTLRRVTFVIGRESKGLDMRKCAAVALLITAVVVPVVNVAAPTVFSGHGPWRVHRLAGGVAGCLDRDRRNARRHGDGAGAEGLGAVDPQRRVAARRRR